MSEHNFSDMTGKVLIASPYAMQGNVFHKSIIYVVQHTKESSVGLIFNQAMSNMPADNLFRKINDNLTLPDLDLEVHIGGPVELERGFFLHTLDYNKNLLFQAKDNLLGVSSNTDIVKDIAEGAGPDKVLFILGYTGWGAGQMEFELENNLWIVAKPDNDLIFEEHSHIKWDLAISTLGISQSDFIPSMANC